MRRICRVVVNGETIVGELVAFHPPSLIFPVWRIEGRDFRIYATGNITVIEEENDANQES